MNNSLFCQHRLFPSLPSPHQHASLGQKPQFLHFLIYLPWHFLYFFPDPHGQGSFLPTPLSCVWRGRSICAIGADDDCGFKETLKMVWTMLDSIISNNFLNIL